MEEVLSYFPREIALQILEYTYQVQDKTLLSDIVNFTKFKSRPILLYRKTLMSTNHGYQMICYFI